MERITWYSDLPLPVRRLFLIVSSIFLCGLFFSFLIIISTIISSQMYLRNFCLSNNCIDNFFKDVSSVGDIMSGAVSLCVAIATIGGIFVALMNYIASQKNFAFNNHIEHLKVFCDYMDLEISKRDRLSKKSFDYLVFYGLIFEKSRDGSSEVSEKFSKFIDDLNYIIDRSNSICDAKDQGFDYKKHQRYMRDHFGSIGISIYFAPRVDYFDMERQLLSLVNRVAQSFCESGRLKALRDIRYY